MSLPFVLKIVSSLVTECLIIYLPVCTLSSRYVLNHSNYPCPNHYLYLLLWTHQLPHNALLSSVLNYPFRISRPSINPPQFSLFLILLYLCSFSYTFSSYTWNKPPSLHMSSFFTFIENQHIFDVRSAGGSQVYLIKEIGAKLPLPVSIREEKWGHNVQEQNVEEWCWVETAWNMGQFWILRIFSILGFVSSFHSFN